MQHLETILGSRHPLVRFCILSVCGLFMWGFIYLGSVVAHAVLTAACYKIIGTTISEPLNSFLFTLCVLCTRAYVGTIR